MKNALKVVVNLLFGIFLKEIADYRWPLGFLTLILCGFIFCLIDQKNNHSKLQIPDEINTIKQGVVKMKSIFKIWGLLALLSTILLVRFLPVLAIAFVNVLVAKQNPTAGVVFGLVAVAIITKLNDNRGISRG